MGDLILPPKVIAKLSELEIDTNLDLKDLYKVINAIAPTLPDDGARKAEVDTHEGSVLSGIHEVIQDVIANRPAAGVAGRLFFSTDERKLYRDTGTAWEEITAIERLSTHEGKVTDVHGVVSPDEIASKSYVDARAVPTNLVAVWTGLLTEIPSGWALCDGGDGRPNLLDYFVKSVPDALTDPGTTGGASTHQHADGTNVGTSPTAIHHLRDAAYGLGAATSRTEYMETVASAYSPEYPVLTSSEPNVPPFYEVAFIIKLGSPEYCFRCGKELKLGKDLNYILPAEPEHAKRLCLVVERKFTRERYTFASVKLAYAKYHELCEARISERSALSKEEREARTEEIDPAPTIKTSIEPIPTRITHYCCPDCLKRSDKVIWSPSS